MSSIFDQKNLLKVYGLDALAEKLTPIIGKTIYYLIQVFWNHWGEDKGTNEAYRLFLNASLKTLLESYNDAIQLYNNETSERANAVMAVLISKLYEHSKPYLREQGVEI